jgi:alpha-D-ribose 1-methylphosphonate 5-triphosphate diphosphatase
MRMDFPAPGHAGQAAGELLVRNARMVLAGEVIEGGLAARDGRITSVDPGRSSSAGAVDFDGDYLMPGMVELHTDNFEKHLMPRPKVRWPEFPALLAHDAEIAAAGITTVFDALGVGDSDLGALRSQNLEGVLDALANAAREGLLRADHLIHARCELPAPNTVALFAPFEAHPLLGLVSLMDHTPGQRQWTNMAAARTYYTGKKGWTDARFDQAVAEAPELQARYAQPNRRYFVEFARRRGVPLATHDDTVAGHVEEAERDGAAFSEFPTTPLAAAEARRRGIATIMGAPNVVRGGSHSGNVAAIDLARARTLDVLSSDYVPASLLTAAMILERDAGWTLSEAVATVTRNPARSAGLADRGEIAPGLRADLLRVRRVNGHPVVLSVWRGGVRVC